MSGPLPQAGVVLGVCRAKFDPNAFLSLAWSPQPHRYGHDGRLVGHTVNRSMLPDGGMIYVLVAARDPAMRDRAQKALVERSEARAAITLIDSADEDSVDIAMPAILSILEKAGTSTIRPLADTMDGAPDDRFVIYVSVLSKSRVQFPMLVRSRRSRSPRPRSLMSYLVSTLRGSEEGLADVRTRGGT